MNSKNSDSYVASLEARVEEFEKKVSDYENKMSEMAPLKANEKLFLEFAKKQFEDNNGIYRDDMDEYFKHPVPKNIVHLMYRKTKKKISGIFEHLSENRAAYIVCSIIAGFFLTIIIGGTYDYRCRKENERITNHIAEVTLKIDGLVNNDLNKDGVITDDNRRIVIKKFVKDNNLKINEEDFYECVRNKRYSNVFYNSDGGLLGVDDVYKLITAKAEK